MEWVKSIFDTEQMTLRAVGRDLALAECFLR